MTFRYAATIRALEPAEPTTVASSVAASRPAGRRPRDPRPAPPEPGGTPERVATTPAAATTPAERVEASDPPGDPIRRDDPDSAARASAMVREAQSAMLRGEVARARDLFRDATVTSSSSAAAWRGLGLASERLGQRPEARRAYERYLRVAPRAADAETVRARLAALGE